MKKTSDKEVTDYLQYKKATAKSKAKQADVDKLAKEVNKNWWKKNRSKFILSAK